MVENKLRFISLTVVATFLHIFMYKLGLIGHDAIAGFMYVMGIVAEGGSGTLSPGEFILTAYFWPLTLPVVIWESVTGRW